ncbi:MAG: hypothetical protein EXR73_10730 [Myxococcales bacterium]|nr:hypothetical protein [Myxococcales bacterium]
MAPFSFSQVGTTLQPLLIRAYKVVGLFALGGILLGLVGFLTINVFYLLDRSWIRPVILSAKVERVVLANASLADAMNKRDGLAAQRRAAEAEVARLERVRSAADRFDAAIAAEPGATMSAYEKLMLGRERELALAERASASDRRTALERELATLDANLVRYDRLVAQSKDSPFIRAVEQRLIVAFVPYENLPNASPGVAIYGCRWGLIGCSHVGRVGARVDGEVQDSHPHDKGLRRGHFVEIRLDESWAAEENALFVGGRPFFIL